MDQHRSPSIFRRAAPGLALLAVVALGVGLVALPTDGPSEPTTQPAASYASLQNALRDGRGKGIDQGIFDVWTSVSPTPTLPTAWVWVVDDTVDGDGTEIWAYHVDYVHPGPDEDAEVTFRYSDDEVPETIDDFIHWILENNTHVGDESELTLVKNSASLVE